MASLVTVDEIRPQLLEALTDAAGSARAALYLADAAGGPYAAAAAIGMPASPGGVGGDAPLVARLREARDPIVLAGGADAALPAGLAGTFGEGSVALPLVWRGTLTGFILTWLRVVASTTLNG